MISGLIILIVLLLFYFRQAYAEKMLKLKEYKEKQLDYWVTPLEDGEIQGNCH